MAPEAFFAHVFQNAVADAAAPKPKPAAQLSWKHLNLLRFDGGQPADADAAKVTFIVECAGVAEIARQAQLGFQFDAVPIDKPRKCGRIGTSIFFANFAGKNGRANAERPGKLHIIELDKLGFQVKALSGPAAGKQHTVIGDVSDDLNALTVQKFPGRNNVALNRCGHAGKGAGAQQRQYSRKLG